MHGEVTDAADDLRVTPLRPLLVSLAIVALWAVLWAATVVGLVTIALAIDPKVVGPGEGPTEIVWIGAREGAITGAVFALLLVAFERRRPLAEMGYLRAAAWGVLAAAILRLTQVTDVHFSNSAVVGTLSAIVSVALARAGIRRPHVPVSIGLVLVCSSSCAITPETWPHEPFTSEAWKTARWEQRYVYYESLAASGLLEGATQRRIVELLGPSDSRYDPRKISYLVRKRPISDIRVFDRPLFGDMSDIRVLDIRFGDDGKVKKYFIRGT